MRKKKKKDNKVEFIISDDESKSLKNEEEVFMYKLINFRNTKIDFNKWKDSISKKTKSDSEIIYLNENVSILDNKSTVCINGFPIGQRIEYNKGKERIIKIIDSLNGKEKEYNIEELVAKNKEKLVKSKEVIKESNLKNISSSDLREVENRSENKFEILINIDETNIFLDIVNFLIRNFDLEVFYTLLGLMGLIAYIYLTYLNKENKFWKDRLFTMAPSLSSLSSDDCKDKDKRAEPWINPVPDPIKLENGGYDWSKVQKWELNRIEELRKASPDYIRHSLQFIKDLNSKLRTLVENERWNELLTTNSAVNNIVKSGRYEKFVWEECRKYGINPNDIKTKLTNSKLIVEHREFDCDWNGEEISALYLKGPRLYTNPLTETYVHIADRMKFGDIARGYETEIYKRLKDRGISIADRSKSFRDLDKLNESNKRKLEDSGLIESNKRLKKDDNLDIESKVSESNINKKINENESTVLDSIKNSSSSINKDKNFNIEIIENKGLDNIDFCNNVFNMSYHLSIEGCYIVILLMSILFLCLYYLWMKIIKL